MNTEISILVNEEQDMYCMNFKGSYFKIITQLLLAIVCVMDKFGIDKNSNKAKLRQLCFSLGENLYDLITEGSDKRKNKLKEV
jgi:hypothetical protein